MYFELFGQMKKQLGQLDAWLVKAAAYAEAKKFDGSVYATQRLAPDQFAFARQVQAVCDTAKLGASRLTGKEAPSQPDTEVALEELRARVQSVVAYLDGLTAKDFDGVATREVTQPRWEGKKMMGPAYFVEHVLPNFYFHLTHAFAILRHSGVPVGKSDYLGALTKI